MNNKTWWLLGIIAVACISGGYYVYAQKSVPKSSPLDLWAQQDAQMSAIMKRMFSGQWSDLFADHFFDQKLSPFAGMDNLHRQLQRLSKEEARDLFGLTWNDKFPARMDIAAVDPVIKSTKDRVIVSLKVPRAKGDSLKVNINKNEIRLGYTVNVLNEKNNGKGVYEKSESEERFQQILSIPPEADAKTAKVTREGDTVTITFARSPKAVS